MKIRILCDHLSITTTNSDIVLQSLDTVAVHDFEDGLEYFSALSSNCNCIITEDVDDFYFSKIEVLSPENFFTKYLLNPSKN